MTEADRRPVHVVFNHGRESGPTGGKIRVLTAVAERAGHTTESLDYRDLRDDPEARVARLRQRLDVLGAPAFLVGSSMGAYVALAAAQHCAVTGLFLMAPAAYLPGYAVQRFAPCPAATVVHGWGDELIPSENALRLAREIGGELHLLHADHRLAAAHEMLAALLDVALRRTGAA